MSKMKIVAVMAALMAAKVTLADPGLALYRFDGDGRFLNCAYSGTITNNFKSYLDRKHKDSWARGILEVPSDGVYTFKTVANRTMMRLDGIEYCFRDKADFVEHEVKLTKGAHAFEVFISNRWGFGRDGDMNVYWRKPGDADYSPIPAEQFSHTDSDLNLKTPIVSDVDLKLNESSSCFLKYGFNVTQSGFYRLKFRRCGLFRWSNSTPSDSTGVWVDGKHMRHFYTAREFGDDFFDDDVVVMYFESGAHTLEVRGQSADSYLKESPRIWITQVDAKRDAERTFTVSEKLQGETVFRMGEDIEWNVRRSTLDCTSPLEVSVKVIRQRKGEVVWEKSAVLPFGKTLADARFAFPKNLDGTFECSFFAGGKLVEGPWEFCVIDTARPKARIADPSKPLPTLESFGKLVDTVDFGREGLNGEHHIRDNGTSKTVTAGKITYRESGTMREGRLYCNMSARDGSLPVPLVGTMGKEKTADGKAPFGLTRRLSASDWFAATLKVSHPQVAHVAVAYLPNDVYRRFPVQLIDCKTAHSNGAFYEILPAEEPGLVKMTIPFWPNSDAIDLLMVPSDNHGHPRRSTSAIAKIELYEFPDGFPEMPEAACGWNPKRYSGWSGEQGDLSPERASTPPIPDDSDWFAPDFNTNTQVHRPVWYDYTAYSMAWRRFGEYARWQGQNFLQWPIWSYNMAHVQTERLPWGSGLFIRGVGWRPVDKYRRNSFKIILLMCEKYGVDFWGDIQLNHNVGREIAKGNTIETLATNNSFVATVISSEKIKDLKELDGCFLLEGQRLGGNFNPAHPVGRSYLKHFYGDIAEYCRDLPAFKGMNLRQWNACSSCVSAWWCSALAGYDDWTLDLFEKETGIKRPENVEKLAERQAWYMTNDAVRVKWFDWRADKVASLRGEILSEMRKYRKNAVLRSSVEKSFAPVTELGMGLDRAKLTKDEGFNLSEGSISVQGNEMCALDPVVFQGFDIRPQVVHTNEPLWMVKCRSYYLNGLCTGAGMLAPPYSTRGFAQAMADGALDFALWGSYWAYPADNVEVREFVRTMRAVPELDFEKIGGDVPDPSVVCRRAGKIAYFVSLRPFTQKISLDVWAEDMVRGTKGNAFELSPFGLLLVRTSKPVENFSVGGVKGQSSKIFGGKKSPDPSATSTVTLSVRNLTAKARKNALCVVKCGALMDKGIKTPQLKLFSGGKEIPVQLDRCDARGRYSKLDVSSPLKATDEICFLHDFADGEEYAELVLTEGGRPAMNAEVPFEFSNDIEVYNSNNRFWTNGILRVKSGAMSVEFCGLGVSALELDGVSCFNGQLDKPRNRHLFNSLPPGLKLTLPADDRIRCDADGCRVLSAGPVRALIGYVLPDIPAYRMPMRGEPKEITYPAFTEFGVGSVWQFTAGSKSVDSILRLSYRESYMPQIELLWWQNAFYRYPSTPMDTKTFYAGSISAPLSFKWNQPVENRCWGDKGGISSTWYVFSDSAQGGAYGEAMDPALAARGGFSIAGYIASVMEMRDMPRKDGVVDFRRAFRVWENDPGVDEATAWASSAFISPPVITVIKQ